MREITGATIHETVPDTILADAEIELVDLSPENLLQRLALVSLRALLQTLVSPQVESPL